jgi:hypothetical protein
MDLKQASEIVCEFVESENLRKHMLVVKESGEDGRYWVITCAIEPDQ